ncbi:RNA methyltransferase [Coralliovum pocilloporae]|uniref:RNA methyltransferase n=1 Tax=Coralliovum pocilloporae TaxID=3066369 RepID=UPI003306AF35
MRGYFAIGVEGLSKPMNFGNLIRSAHAFGASFFFTVDSGKHLSRIPRSDTSKSAEHIPYYPWESADEMLFPKGCSLVGVELTDEAIELPSFRHPIRAAYVMGPERGSLSTDMQARCDLIVKIPTQFCINVATAGAIIMYDRVKSLGGFPERPVWPRGDIEEKQKVVFGGPRYSGGKRLPS